MAYYSVLVFNVLDVASFEEYDLPDTLDDNTHEQIKICLMYIRILILKIFRNATMMPCITGI